ncbi:hypothetical protein TrLO_g15860 [Triparma laevis f. longispina]|uniref:Uncharacterized protein n=1 Tax=Triparma laevis f. longispina TaxID=1714387 RepID=A0A9W7APY7_9STRA|nr:hypothetical protein TrLO_g15860 [Triparma laevis f. longispina]
MLSPVDSNRLETHVGRLVDIEAALQHSKELRRNVRDVTYNSLLQLKALQGSESTLGTITKKMNTPSPVQNTVQNTRIKEEEEEEEEEEENGGSGVGNGEEEDNFSSSGFESSPSSSMSSSDLLLGRGTSISKDNHDMNSVKFISHNNGYSRKRLGSILTQSKFDITPEVGGGRWVSGGGPGVNEVASVDLKIHHKHMFNTTSSAVQGKESLDVVTVTKNDLYDMRILSDNPRDFSNTSTVLSGVNIGQKAKELLKVFKRDRDIRETGSGEDLRASLRASMMDDERSFRQSGGLEEELDWLGVEVEERGEVEASPPRPRPPLSVPLSPRVKAENNGANSPRVRRGGTRNSLKRPPSLSLSCHDHDHDEQSIGDLDLRDVVTPSIIPPAPPTPKQSTIDFSRVEDLEFEVEQTHLKLKKLGLTNSDLSYRNLSSSISSK